jgi:hypothetical protein
MEREPGPELTPRKYWLTPDEDQPGLAAFTQARDGLKAVVGVLLGLALPMIVMVSLGPRDAAWYYGLALIVVVLFAAGSFAAIIHAQAGPSSGIWTVDKNGWPVKFVAKKPPEHLRRDRGLTREAFVDSARTLNSKG